MTRVSSAREVAKDLTSKQVTSPSSNAIPPLPPSLLLLPAGFIDWSISKPEHSGSTPVSSILLHVVIADSLLDGEQPEPLPPSPTAAADAVPTNARPHPSAQSILVKSNVENGKKREKWWIWGNPLFTMAEDVQFLLWNRPCGSNPTRPAPKKYRPSQPQPIRALASPTFMKP